MHPSWCHVVDQILSCVGVTTYVDTIKCNVPLRVEGRCRVVMHPSHQHPMLQHEHPSHVLDTFIIVVMDVSNMWRAAGCDVCIREILDMIVTWMQTSQNTSAQNAIDLFSVWTPGPRLISLYYSNPIN